MDGVDIRQAAPTDAQEMAAVDVATWRSAYHGLMPDEFLAGLSPRVRANWWRANLSSLPDKRAVFVADVAGRVVGFCQVGPSRDDDADPVTGELYSIYVEPNFMGQGIGMALLRAGEQTMCERGHHTATLWVLEGNERGRAFYERNGWQADGAMRTREWGSVPLRSMRYRVDFTDRQRPSS
jgi:ribosomal protein S18 acetylase RimI-like enzyme